MMRRNSIFRNPKSQIWLAFFAVVILYFFSLGQQGVANDLIVLEDGQIFIAAGEDKGLWLVNENIPVELAFSEASTFDTPGSAEGLAYDAEKQRLYVADGKRGLIVFDVSDLAAPKKLGSLDTPGVARQVVHIKRDDIAPGQEYVYLVDNEGLRFINVTRPDEPTLTGNYMLIGEIKGIAVRSPYVYVALGGLGIHVLDASNPGAPFKTGMLNSPRNALGITLDDSGAWGFIANGASGLQVTDTNPAGLTEIGIFDRTSIPNLADDVEEQIDVRDVYFQYPYAYIANGAHGLLMLDVSNPAAPVKVGALDTPGTAKSITMSNRGVIYLADGSGGLQIIDVSIPQAPYLRQSFETPGEASLMQISQDFLSTTPGKLLAGPSMKVRVTLRNMMLDFLIFGVGGFLIWLAFFSQFVLPLHNIGERINVAMRLFLYATGSHGPAVFIQDGQIIQRRGEGKTRGPGVIILDTCSAAVLRIGGKFTRAVGPGTVFTSRIEYIARAVPLLRQFRTLGPKPGEDPFKKRGKDETPEDYAARQERRWETRGLTRDGIEVVPFVVAAFRLRSDPCSYDEAEIKNGAKKPCQNTRFGYDENAVLGAILHENINPDAPHDTDTRRQSWQWIPVYLVADLWREYLRKFTLNELFSFAPPLQENDADDPPQTAYQIISRYISLRLTNEYVEELDEIGRPTGQKMRSREYDILQKRGIDIMFATAHTLRFPENVEKQLVKQWIATWAIHANMEELAVNHSRSLHKNMGRETGLRDFADAASRSLGMELINNEHNPDEAQSLELLLRGTLEQCIQDPALHQHLTNEKIDLEDLIEWVRRH